MRNVFNNNGVSRAILKASYGFNTIGTRDSKINRGTIKKDCPRYGELEESWEHIV